MHSLTVELTHACHVSHNTWDDKTRLVADAGSRASRKGASNDAAKTNDNPKAKGLVKTASGRLRASAVEFVPRIASESSLAQHPSSSLPDSAAASSAPHLPLVADVASSNAQEAHLLSISPVEGQAHSNDTHLSVSEQRPQADAQLCSADQSSGMIPGPSGGSTSEHLPERIIGFAEPSAAPRVQPSSPSHGNAHPGLGHSEPNAGPVSSGPGNPPQAMGKAAQPEPLGSLASPKQGSNGSAVSPAVASPAAASAGELDRRLEAVHLDRPATASRTHAGKQPEKLASATASLDAQASAAAAGASQVQ